MNFSKQHNSTFHHISIYILFISYFSFQSNHYRSPCILTNIIFKHNFISISIRRYTHTRLFVTIHLFILFRAALRKDLKENLLKNDNIRKKKKRRKKRRMKRKMTKKMKNLILIRGKNPKEKDDQRKKKMKKKTKMKKIQMITALMNHLEKLQKILL